MAEFAFVVDAPPTISVEVVGSQARFPIRRIYCVGRNYAEHIREMGGDERELPFFFQKPADAIVADGKTVEYPTCTADFQHEIELVIAIGRAGADIPIEDAAAHVFGLAVGIDLTRRDVQIAARKAGRPWEIGKSFDHSAPISAIVPLSRAALPTQGEIALHVNGERRQCGDLSQMIWKSEEIISQLSRQYRLVPGDVIFTGTPAGVSAVSAGDVIEGRIADVGRLTIRIGDA